MIEGSSSNVQTQMRLPDAAVGLTEATSQAIAQNIQWTNVTFGDRTVATSYICQGEGTPVLLLHGFDSSLFEFRRLIPELAEQFQVWAVDLLGFGFCDRASVDSSNRASVDSSNRADLSNPQAIPQINPDLIKQHLLAFCQRIIGQPVVLIGASMGGGAAIDFAVSHPEQVKQLILIDAVGFASGPAIGKFVPRPLDKWVFKGATNFLRNAGVRRKISEKAYYDKAFVTPDASLCASLHLLMPKWQEALIAFTKSGGYNFLSKKVSQITMPTLVIWGRHDKILGYKDASRFEREIPGCKLVWIEDCGHVPHLEQPAMTAKYIAVFVE